ncbi:2-oxoglutarate mitochondrial-like isoform B [Chlorella sorokiniana]|uniref:2-oxoglutarate dehydrogenase, mitochondrial n=1 Tax=Chlorella sorokiniana TaxID=3076 RepID=A0A2P6TV97_CHLSO|nr:2-oxoglutarate mitochondrial-like isoform B [Chlorella sorokiniana]|eukprot:PRW57990.1 2-oxoglutarate mitochondrial-like isoform B [Chlorella sorokiniana]
MDMGVPAEAVAEAYDAWEKGEVSSPLTAAAISNQTIQESMRLLLMVRAFQVMGHYSAQLDPLGLDERPKIKELDPAYYGFSEKDLDREFYLGTWNMFYLGTWNMEGFMAEGRQVRTLREILERLRETYCGSIGFEYMHIPDSDKCNWLRARIETAERQEYSQEEKLRILDRLTWSEMFESFLANKYTAAKRFGLEGCEVLIPGMKALIDRGAELGVESVVIGMPHRGRLNVLANVMRKPMEQVFSEFAGRKPVKEVHPDDPDTYMGSGDVKYHLGTSYDRPTISGKRIHLSLLANPSHLEAVNTVAMGKVRAKQYYSDDQSRTANMPILLHGDGAFAGQGIGIVYEALDMSQLPEYTVGGTIHLVVNNQVAFTTDPRKSRSSPYCTDVAKALACPVFHVNADDAEAVTRVCELAAEWRQEFKTDVVIDLIGYRRYGHNEIDEPMFTQPLMYQAIKRHKNALQVYQDRLLREGSIPKEQIRGISDKVQKMMHDAFEGAKEYKPKKSDWLSSYWAGFMSPSQHSRIRNTGVPMDLLREVGYAITRLPEDFTPHRQIAKVYEARRNMVESGEGIDWGMGEALAFGTLLAEGNHVRLSGQDVERGTFSHRHAVLHDQKSGSTFTPLEHVFHGQRPKQFTVSNSSLSEYGVLGFELGYSIENPNALVIWEAQFGDFANGAQIIFDQFISSGEAKWLRQSGLVVLLPHGYDGQGPEHSSGRMERFLQMVDEDPYKLPTIDESKWFIGGHLGSQIQSCNWQIVNCTTPANYYHVLRRQLHRQFRKPLIMFAPKNLLRHPLAKSPLAEFSETASDKDPNIQGVRFKRVIMDESSTDRSWDPPKQPEFKRIVFCSGKVYYELAAERARQGKQGEVAIIRIEQLAPFPFDLVMREMRRFPNAEVLWAQEEPMNMGAYLHVQPRLQRCMEATDREVQLRVKYSGRPTMASTATGFGEVHAQEQADLIAKALDVNF